MADGERRYPSDEQYRFIVRLPDGMREQIKAEAEKNNRSMNAEVVHRLELTFRFDLDVGAEERMKSEAGPLADFINEKFAELSLQISDLKAQLGLDPLK